MTDLQKLEHYLRPILGEDQKLQRSVEVFQWLHLHWYLMSSCESPSICCEHLLLQGTFYQVRVPQNQYGFVSRGVLENAMDELEQRVGCFETVDMYYISSPHLLSLHLCLATIHNLWLMTLCGRFQGVLRGVHEE